jgi:AraC-like DNA-binding protein
MQPAVKDSENGVSYKEYFPAKQLEELIHCYWQLQSLQPLKEAFSYRVVSDGCIDIFFNMNRREESFAMGFCKKYTSFSIGTEFNYVGIRFYPSVFPKMFGFSAYELRDKESWLIDVLPKMAEWLLVEMSGEMTVLRVKLDHYFCAWQKEHEFSDDPRFEKALMLILKRKGYLEVENDLDIGLSPRQLRRIFNFYIGTSPKSFCKVVRFQHILKQQEKHRDARIYEDLGYYDQSHFIKEFKTFYGLSPSEAIS